MSSSVPRGPSVYLAVLRSPGVSLLGLGAALASLPIGFLGLALLLVVREHGGAFTAGGALVAALGTGTVAGMLAQGPLIDRFGARLVLLPAAAVRLLAGGCFLVHQQLPLAVTVGLVAIVGAGEPQVSNALRATLPRLVDVELRPAAAAVSALLFELPVLAGPLLLTVVLFVAPPGAAVLLAMLCSAAGAGLFTAGPVHATPTSTPSPRPIGRGAGRRRGPASIPAVRRLAALIAVQGFAVGVAQVASAARLTAQGSAGRAGLLYAALTAGSLAGIATAGARASHRPRPRTVPFLLLGSASATGAAATAPTTPLLALCLLVFGACAGPLVLGCFVDIGRSTPDDAATAAVTVLVAAGLAATSAGAAVAGWLVDIRDPAAPLLVAMGALLTACLITSTAALRTRSKAR